LERYPCLDVRGLQLERQLSLAGQRFEAESAVATKRFLFSVATVAVRSTVSNEVGLRRWVVDWNLELRGPEILAVVAAQFAALPARVLR
jgi:hypothetical protein